MGRVVGMVIMPLPSQGGCIKRLCLASVCRVHCTSHVTRTPL